MDNELITKADSPDKQHNASSTRHRQKKYRYKRQGHHKYDKDNARRMEARAFLSGITLDTLKSRSTAAGQLEDVDVTIFYASSPNAVRKKPNSSAQVMEVGLVSCGLQPGEQRLHEMAAEMYDLHNHYSLKLTPSRSHEHDFEHNLPNCPSLLLRSSSMFDSSVVYTPSYEQRKISVGPGQSDVGMLGMGSDPTGMIHYCESSMSWSLVNSRLVLVSSGVAFATYSILGYKSGEEKFNLEHPQRQRNPVKTSILPELDTELGTSSTMLEVSLAHLILPLHLQLEVDSGSILTNSSSTKKGSGRLSDLNLQLQAKQLPRLYSLRASYIELLGKTLPCVSGTSFQWTVFRDHHNAQEVLLHYHPLCMDNSDYFVGHHISTMSVLSYRVSFIHYATPSEIKQGINDQFSDTFPHIKITLSKLRRIKEDVLNIATETSLDLAAVAYSYVYFEKLMMMGKVNKLNRKVIAGVCLLLAAKFFIDMKKQELKALLEEISDTFRVGTEEVVAHELPVLIALNFSLLTPVYQAFYHYEKLKDRLVNDAL